ncbi:MAG: hypothetical protein AB7K86_09425 [Rhodospirillales bacterium]
MSDPSPAAAKRVAQILASVALVAIAGLLVTIIAGLNGGAFTYTLDDPYIHLSVSEKIAAGGYGINFGEPSAASSSILYPLLLAPFAGTAWHHLVPLAINAAALVAFAWTLVEFLFHIGVGTLARRPLFIALFAAAVALSFNLVGLVFSGMEHNLHVALAALGVLGLAIFLREGRVAWWLVPVLIAAPLVRYEATLASLAGAAVLIARGAVRPGAVAAATVIAALAAFSAFLLASGLAPLPSSVLVKSSSALSGAEGTLWPFVGSILINISDAMSRKVGAIMIVAAVLAVYLALVTRRGAGRRDPTVPMAAYLAVTVAGHAMFGQFGWFHRYEIYALVVTFMAVLFLFRDPIAARLAQPRGGVALLLVIAAAAFVTGKNYVYATLLEVPIAANNIFEQQVQMRRFVTEHYRNPVAANDVGLLTWGNPDYVLDLWGLGSEEARKLRAARRDGEWMARLAAARGIGLALVYEDGYFKTPFPETWVRVGRLHLSRARVTPARSAVTFFATEPAEAERLRALLRAFAPTLPAGVALDVL